MSKRKGKGKGKGKPQQEGQFCVTRIVLQLENKTRQLLDATFTIKKLQERLDRFEEEHRQIYEKYNLLKESSNKKIDEQVIKFEQKKILMDKSDQISSLQFSKTQIKNEFLQKINELEQEKNRLSYQLKGLQKQLENKQITFNQIIKEMHSKVIEAEEFIKIRDQKQKQSDNLRYQLEFEKKDKERAIADKDREKAQATDKLKNDMLRRIHQTKQSLLALKREQFDTTTRLTVLQNHQLTSQLQYQSKQTEKLLFKNQELKNKVINFQRDIQIHKQVEQQLVKRSHYGQKLIKNLTQKIKNLEEQGQKKQKKQDQKVQQKNIDPNQNKRKNEIIAAMQKNQQTLEKKYAKLESDYEILKSQNNFLQNKLLIHQHKVQRLGNLLVKYLESIISNQQIQGKTINYDLHKLTNKPVQQWEQQQLEVTIFVLLDWIKPLLSKNNISFPKLKYNVEIIDDSFFPMIEQDDPQIKVRKTQIKSKLQGIPMQVATKIVRSNLREWGKSIPSKSTIPLARKFKI